MGLEQNAAGITENTVDLARRQHGQQGQEIVAPVTGWRGRCHAVGRHARHDETKIVSLKLVVGLFRRERFAEFIAPLASGTPGHAGPRHQVALVGRVDEHPPAQYERRPVLGAEPGGIDTAPIVRRDRHRHGIEHEPGPQADGRVGGEHFLEHQQIHLRLAKRTAERIAHLGRVRAVTLGVVRLDTLRETEERARQGLERPEIRMGQSAGDQAADAAEGSTSSTVSSDRAAAMAAAMPAGVAP
jgi:hypothetical protein